MAWGGRVRSWTQEANATIAAVHARLPAGASLEERKAAVDAAYPFGARELHPYNIWLRERRNYLAKFGYRRKAKEEKGTLL